MNTQAINQNEIGKQKRERTHRTKIRDRQLPDYTRGEEIFNMTSHIVGGGLAVVILALCMIFSLLHHNIWGLVSGIVYGISMILLYTMSSIYHGLIPLTAKKVFQVLDHCSVYILIAGTYTPILLTGMRKHYPVIAWVIFGIVWGVSALAITLNAIDLKKYRVFSMICYLAIGWCIIFAFLPLIRSYNMEFFGWILSGGIAYTVGAVFYCTASKSKHRYIHSVFHLFVLLGSILQAVGIIRFCM